jgi:hypothetical protein
MARERQHQHRERGGTTGQEGITPRSRNHYGLFNPETNVCFKLYPDNTEGIRAAHQDILNKSTSTNPRRAAHIKFGTVMLYQPEGATEPQRVQHGINDGTEVKDHANSQAEFYKTNVKGQTNSGNWVD